MTAWYLESLSARVPAGGAVGIDGHFRRGGEFEPFFIPRGEMPQIDEGDLIDLLVHLTENGAAVTTVSEPPSNLIFHQRITEGCVPPADSPLLHKPLLISRDGFVLDGNHRAIAHKRYGTDAVCLKIDADFGIAMALLFAFPKTYTYERKVA